MQPVFWDPTGRRFRKVVAIAMTLALVVIALGVVAFRSVLTPLVSPLINQGMDFPRAALSQQDVSHMPIVGDTEHAILNRVLKVERRSDAVYITDPYSNHVVRTATEVDRGQIKQGDSYVVDYYGNGPKDKQLMLTFDDGPDETYTAQILDVLSREKVPATFFVLGSSVAKHPDILRRVIREGHMVGNHTMTHIEFDDENDGRNRLELLLASRAIRAAGHYDTPVFRIPHGDPDDNALALLEGQQQGLAHVDFDIDTLDWQYKPEQAVPVPQLDGKGHVVLLHDSGGDRSETVRTVETLIRTAKAQGYTFSTVQPLLVDGVVPRRDIVSSPADRLTLWSLQAIWVWPGALLTILFWVGMGSLVVMSVLYLGMALLFMLRQRGVNWTGLDVSKLPYVTVVLSAYNEEKVIKRTLDSLRMSRYPVERFEVIVVDDGSADGTLAITKAYAEKWPQLTVIAQANNGKAAAINRAIARARRESTVIVTLDADTLFQVDTVVNLARHFVPGVHDGTVGIVAGHVKVGNRRNILTAWQSLEYISGICVTRTAEGLMRAISIVPGACSAWSREALERIGGLSSETLAEDADATLKLQRLGYEVVQENDAVAYTEAPETVRALASQRKRWMFGTMQALWLHRGMMFRPRHGLLGMVSLPYAALCLLIPLVFFPLTVFAG